MLKGVFVMVEKDSLTGYERDVKEDLWLWDDVPEMGFDLNTFFIECSTSLR